MFLKIRKLFRQYWQKQQNALKYLLTGVTHRENFSVAGFLMPKHMRSVVLDIYRFARFSDNISDELDLEIPLSIEERKILLQGLDAFLLELNALKLSSLNHLNHIHIQKKDLLNDIKNLNIIWMKISQKIPNKLFNYLNKNLNLSFWQGFYEKIITFDLDISMLRALLSAFLQDLEKNIYLNHQELDDYCQRSANPIGQLLLQLYQNLKPVSKLKSDAICSAFQLINMYQDVFDDWQKHRLYLPLDELLAHDCIKKSTAHIIKDIPVEIYKDNFFTKKLDDIFEIESLEHFLKQKIKHSQQILKENIDLIKQIQPSNHISSLHQKLIIFEIIFSISIALKACDNFLKKRYNINHQSNPSVIAFYQWPVIIFNTLIIYGCKNLLPAKSSRQQL